MRSHSENAAAHERISSICPVAAAACRAPIVGPDSFASRARPAAMAPEVTRITSRPPRTAASTSAASRK